MAGVRSPNYPNHSLSGALDLARKLYEKDGRNKVAKATLATHLGHDALSGPALGKIGAMRAYGLIGGSGDELQITQDAIAALQAPEGSLERKNALIRLAFNPPIFQEIRKQYQTRPSRDALMYWLESKGFSAAAASIASSCYLDTLSVVESIDPDCNEAEEPTTSTSQEKITLNSMSSIPVKVQAIAGERELTTGMLSKETNFRLLVRGPVGVKEIERLIAKLELDKEILAEADVEPTNTANQYDKYIGNPNFGKF